MEIDFKQVALQILNFGILFFLLKKFLYQPILKVLSDREDKINKGLATAEKNLKAEEEIINKSKAELAKARHQASKITKDATSEAKEKASNIIAEAKKDAKKATTRLEQKMQEQLNEKEKALQSRIGALVIETTKNILAEALSVKDVERITKTTVKSLR